MKRVVVTLVALLAQTTTAFAQRIHDGPIQRADSTEPCTAAEAKCDRGFIRVKWPQPLPDRCAGPVVLPQGLQRSSTPPTSVRLLVDEQGHVVEVKTEQSSGRLALDEALVSAARKCEFTPGSRGGVPARLPTVWVYHWTRHVEGAPPVPVIVAPAPLPPAPALKVAHCPAPVYPTAAIRAEAEGEVVVGLTVDASGAVTDAEIVRSAGDSRAHKLLDQAARAAMVKCTFNAIAGTQQRKAQRSFTFALTAEPPPRDPGKE